VVDDALKAGCTIENRWNRIKVLTGLAPHLSPKQQGEALAAVRAIWGEEAQAEALMGLMPHLSPEQRDAAMADFLATAERLPRRDVLHFTEDLIATKLFNPSAMATAIIDAQAMWP
jgi:hypothetical protein